MSKKKKQPDKVKDPSEEYKNFQALLQKVVSVPKSEIDAKLKAEKRERKQVRV